VHEQEPDYRFTLANERTFLAWTRTALALTAGGLAVLHLQPPLGPRSFTTALGAMLIVAGGLLPLVAHARWRRVQRAMRENARLPRTTMPILLSSFLAGIATASLIIAAVTTP
jgi:putative membrane protein